MAFKKANGIINKNNAIILYCLSADELLKRKLKQNSKMSGASNMTNANFENFIEMCEN